MSHDGKSRTSGEEKLNKTQLQLLLSINTESVLKIYGKLIIFGEMAKLLQVMIVILLSVAENF